MRDERLRSLRERGLVLFVRERGLIASVFRCGVASPPPSASARSTCERGEFGSLLWRGRGGAHAGERSLPRLSGDSFSMGDSGCVLDCDIDDVGVAAGIESINDAGCGADGSDGSSNAASSELSTGSDSGLGTRPSAWPTDSSMD
eukprot:7376646-Prymnesium_polylepis.1